MSADQRQMMVPASEYDALAEAFREFVVYTNLIGGEQEIEADALDCELGGERADDEIAFLVEALNKGSHALATREAR